MLNVKRFCKSSNLRRERFAKSFYVNVLGLQMKYRTKIFGNSPEWSNGRLSFSNSSLNRELDEHPVAGRCTRGRHNWIEMELDTIDYFAIKSDYFPIKNKFDCI